MLLKHSEQEMDIPRIPAKDLLRLSGDRRALLTKGPGRWTGGTADSSVWSSVARVEDYLRRAALSASLAPAPGPESVPIQGSVPRQLKGERGEVYTVTGLHLEPNKGCIYSVLRTVFHAVITTFPRLHY